MSLRQSCEDLSLGRASRIPVKQVTFWALAGAQNLTQA